MSAKFAHATDSTKGFDSATRYAASIHSACNCGSHGRCHRPPTDGSIRPTEASDESAVARPGTPIPVKNNGRPSVENLSSMQLTWNKSRKYRPGAGTPNSISSPNASKLIPACATISAYNIGGTLGVGRAWYSPNGFVTVISVRACGSMFFTCA